jgi:hypothetical protein
MREKLNENPLAQVALIGVLLVAAALMLLKPLGGGGESEESSGGETAAITTTTPTPSVPAEGGAPSAGVPSASSATVAPASLPTPPLPPAVTAAYNSGKTVVLLLVHPGGVDDALVADATARLATMPGVATFIVPASKIAHYAAITDRLGVDRVPALLVMRPKRLSHGTPTASVSYGFQDPQSIAQAVVDAGYKGRTLSYHP